MRFKEAMRGKIIEIKPNSGVSSSGREWKSMEIVLDRSRESYGERWEEYVALTLFGNESGVVENGLAKVGDIVDVEVSITSRKSKDGRWFSSINGSNLQIVKKNGSGEENAGGGDKIINSSLMGGYAENIEPFPPMMTGGGLDAESVEPF